MKTTKTKDNATKFSSWHAAVAIAENFVEGEGYQTAVVRSGNAWTIKLMGNVGEDDHDKAKGYYADEVF